MQLFNMKDPSEVVTFSQAVQKGLGSGQGLFFPSHFESLGNVSSLLAMPMVERSVEIIAHLLENEIDKSDLQRLIRKRV